jgi:hypothetical protein
VVAPVGKQLGLGADKACAANDEPAPAQGALGAAGDRDRVDLWLSAQVVFEEVGKGRLEEPARAKPEADHADVGGGRTWQIISLPLV